MTLQQLKYVLEVARCGSINEASKNLYISQPSLSNSIKDLEKELAIVIFNRTNKGIVISKEGQEFLGYAKQIIEQTSLLEDKYLNKKNRKIKFSISCQHYSFAINAFVELIKEYGYDEYDFSIQETRTSEIIENVKNLNSEIGILYLNDFNEKVLTHFFKDAYLEFHELFIAKPHVFLSKNHPLSKEKKLTLEMLDDYPFLSFEQGQNNSFYFSEEILSTYPHKKSIKVFDRATLFNLAIGLNGYTISTGIISKELNPDIIAIPLDVDDYFKVGYVKRKDVKLSMIGEIYIDKLKTYTSSLL